MARLPPSPARGAISAALPVAQQPEVAALAIKAPPGAEWISEVKFDGYRLLAAIDQGQVRLLTRSGLDWSDRLPAMRAAIAALGLHTAMLDGELVALRADGVSSFPALQAALKAGRDAVLTYYGFDLLHLDGWDLRPCALLDRKRVLASAARWSGMVRYSDHHEGQAAELYQNACRMGLEGIVCKRGGRPYRPGQSGDWLKLKCLGREEFIVIGYSPPSGSRVGIGGIQLGYRDSG